MDTQFPASLSIDELLKAGKLVKPTCQNKVMLTFEKFDVQTRTWGDVMEVECVVESAKFPSCALRNAYHATLTGKPVNKNQEQAHWVVKTYNAKATKAITETMQSTFEDHCRKQVQMHTVAKHLAKKFQLKAPLQFGECCRKWLYPCQESNSKILHVAGVQKLNGAPPKLTGAPKKYYYIYSL